jgi:hypothetical protein
MGVVPAEPRLPLQTASVLPPWLVPDGRRSPHTRGRRLGRAVGWWERRLLASMADLGGTPGGRTRSGMIPRRSIATARRRDFLRPDDAMVFD